MATLSGLKSEKQRAHTLQELATILNRDIFVSFKVLPVSVPNRELLCVPAADCSHVWRNWLYFQTLWWPFYLNRQMWLDSESERGQDLQEIYCGGITQRRLYKLTNNYMFSYYCKRCKWCVASIFMWVPWCEKTLLLRNSRSIPLQRHRLVLAYSLEMEENFLVKLYHIHKPLLVSNKHLIELKSFCSRTSEEHQWRVKYSEEL